MTINPRQKDAWHPISIFIPGTPRPGGSKKHVGRGRIVESGKHTPAWRKVCEAEAREQYQGEPLRGALRVTFTFHVARPASHFRRNKKGVFLRDDAPEYPATRPDTTKLVRAVEDALTGVLWVDDAQIVWQRAEKQYAAGDGVGCAVEVAKKLPKCML